MRVVLDTNILARAARPGGGPAAEVLTRVRAEPHRLVISSFLVTELERVLNYPRVRALHGLTVDEMRAYVQGIQDMSELADPAVTAAPGICRDPDDELVLQTALAGAVDVLCTLDRHLQTPEVRQYCSLHGIRVVTDIELLALFRQEERKGSPP